jgi:fructose-specific phosphotransferase system IIA component
MVSIYSLLPPECVLLHPVVEDKEKLIKLLINSLEKAGKIIDKERLFLDVMERESLASTGLEHSCAIPHAQSKSLDETVLAVALLDKGIDFNSLDGKMAHLVFLMAGPREKAAEHLKLLSKLSRILHDNNFRESLKKADTVSTFLDLLKNKDA